MTDNSISIGEKIKILRKENNLTLEQVGNAVGVGKSTVRKWENGIIANMRRDKIVSLAKALNTTPAYLLGYAEKTAPAVSLDGIKNIMPLPDTKSIPLVGAIACGAPILAEENITEYLSVDKKIPADFALTCKGDSMINARIYDGDIVYIRIQPDVENGEIAAVRIGEEATLKKVRKYPNKLVLSPCNPVYDDLVYADSELLDVAIIGKAVAFTSTL